MSREEMILVIALLALVIIYLGTITVFYRRYAEAIGKIDMQVDMLKSIVEDLNNKYSEVVKLNKDIQDHTGSVLKYDKEVVADSQKLQNACQVLLKEVRTGVKKRDNTE